VKVVAHTKILTNWIL